MPMKSEILSKLDNPIVSALNETHIEHSIDFYGTVFYKSEYCPFGGFTDIKSTKTGIDSYAKLVEKFFIVGDRPEFGSNILLLKELVCNQMLLEAPIDIDITEDIIELTTDTQRLELFDLVNKVQPGYFMTSTSYLGSYYGIYKDGQLVAVAGERMKMNGFTEVSAVVTHPAYAGRGYAKQLMAKVCAKIFSEGKLPFLHVAETNTGAIALYEKLGFFTRRRMSFWNLGRTL